MASNKIYTKVEIEAVQEGLNHYFPYEIGFISSPKIVDDKWSDLNRVFKWHGRDDFFTTLSEVTKVQKLSFAEIKSASGILEKMKAEAPKTADYKGAEDSPVQANRPGKEMLEQLEKENQTKEAQRKEVVEKSDQEVRSAIKRQQEIYTEQIEKAKVAEAALKNKKIYYKIEKASVKDAQEVQNLKEQAKANPQEYIKDATKQFRNNPSLKNLSKAEVEIISKQTAITSYEILSGNSPLIQSVIISRVASDPKIINSISNPETRKYFMNAAELLTNQKLSQYELSKQLFNFSKIDGYENINDVKIEFSYTPQPGFREFDMGEEIITPYIESLNQQDVLFGSLTGLGESEIKSQILSSAGVRLENYVAKLPANSLLAKTYHSEVVQLGLSQLGIIEAAPWVAVEGSYVGSIAVMSGLGPVAGFVQAKTGIDLGVKLAAKTGVKTATEAGATVIAKTGVETAAKTGLKGAISKLTASLGSAAGPIGTVLGWLGGEALVKIAEKIPWHTVKKWSAAILGGTVGLIALPMVGFGGAVGIGLGATALSASFGGGLGGFTLARAGQGIGSFFGALASAVLGAVGIPILTTFLVFPLVVIFILFMINSGAYIVPPSLSSLGSENPYIDIVKTSDPKGPLQNSDLPLVVTYTITITAKQQALTNVVIKDECSVISEAGSRDCPAPDISVPGGTISVGSPFVFTYTADLDNSYKDSLVVNTVTVTAGTADGGDPQTASGGMSLTIGTPPAGCLKIDGSWPANYKANMESAVGTLASKYSSYLSKVCLSRSEIPLRFSPAGMGGLWGWNAGSYINFFPRGLGNPTDALYILSHELGHSLSGGAKTTYIYAAYLAYPGIKSEAPYCFYAQTASWNPNESLPEAIALTIIEPRCGSVQPRWPIHARFLKNFVFN
jgi:hypothetical protein